MEKKIQSMKRAITKAFNEVNTKYESELEYNITLSSDVHNVQDIIFHVTIHGCIVAEVVYSRFLNNVNEQRTGFMCREFWDRKPFPSHEYFKSWNEFKSYLTILHVKYKLNKFRPTIEVEGKKSYATEPTLFVRCLDNEAGFTMNKNTLDILVKADSVQLVNRQEKKL